MKKSRDSSNVSCLTPLPEAAASSVALEVISCHQPPSTLPANLGPAQTAGFTAESMTSTGKNSLHHQISKCINFSFADKKVNKRIIL